MGKINWGRVVLCGIVAGLAWTVLSSLITAFVARDFVAAVPGGRLSAPSGGLIAFLFIVNLVMGIWAMWLYAAIRPRYGPGPRTAVATGFSWWVISSLVDATWGSFGFVVPKALLAPMAASFPQSSSRQWWGRGFIGSEAEFPFEESSVSWRQGSLDPNNAKILPMLDYREIRPRAPVSSFVECFWTLAGPAVAPGAAAPEPILPDGCMELILNCAAPFRRHHTAATSERQPLRMLVGQMDRHVLIAPTGRVDLLGIRFHPAGARSLLHLPMSELAGRTLPLDEVARTFDRELACALDGSAASRVSRIESVLARRLAAATAHANPAVQAAVGELIRQEGAAGMDALARAAGLGPRQLERRFLDHVGLSPKCLARILRFQRVFRAVTAANVHEESDSGRPNWAAVAADCGYYDQAHLIRDFHQFAGQTPSLLLEAGAALTRYFTRSHRALHTR